MIHHQPAKYHTNPLTHFLNLHNSHATVAAAAAAAAAAASALDQHHQQQMHHHQHHHHLHHQKHSNEDFNVLNNNTIGGDDDCDKNPDLVGGNSLDIENTDTNQSSDVEDNNIDIIDDDDDAAEDGCDEEAIDTARSDNHTPSTTPLDADGIGKSFTIAAILGLKKKQEADGHGFSDVMNLSLNNHSDTASAFQLRISKDSDSLTDVASGVDNSQNHLAHHLSQSSPSLAALQTLQHIHGNAGGFSPHQFHHQHHTAGGGGSATSGGIQNSTNSGLQHLSAHHQQQQQQQQQQQHPAHQGLPSGHHLVGQQTPSSQQSSQQTSHLTNHHHPHHHHQHHHHHHPHHHPHHLAMAAAAAAHHHHAQNHHRDKFKDLAKKSSLSASAALKSKRVRTIFTPEQLERLEAEFERQQYMVGPERLYLAHTLQLTEAQVKVWFQNRRIKWRKHHLEITQQRLALIRQRQIASGVVPPQMGLSNVGGGGDQASPPPPNSNHNVGAQAAMSGGRMVLGPGNGGAESPELTICTDSMEARSVSESDE